MPNPLETDIDPESCLHMALAAHRAGDHAAARLRYAQIPADHCLRADAAHGLAILELQAGHPAEAESLLREALRFKPGLANGEFHLGQALAALGRWDEATSRLQRAAARSPHDAAVWNALGRTLLQAGRHADAVTACRRALKYDRDNPLILCGLADALRGAGRGGESRATYERALAIDPDCAAALANLGALLADRGEFAAAVPLLEDSLALSPENAEVLNTLGVAYRGLGRDSEAAEVLRRAVAAMPGLAAAWNSLAAVLLDNADPAGAEAAARQALQRPPAYANAWLTLGNILRRTARFDEARGAYGEALRIAPELPAAHWNLALLDLLEGDLAGGFRGFEWRLRLPGTAKLYPDLGIPLWQGQDLAGRRLLLYAEQGLGDTLQFVRYVPLLAERGAQVWLRCPASLYGLLRRLPGCAGVLAEDGPLPAVDYCCPMMSLPCRFGTTLASIPSPGAYLAADPALLAQWAQRFADVPPVLRVGLVWAGDPRPGDPDAQRIDRRRSLPLALLAPLLDVAGVGWFSLQKGVASAQLRRLDWRGRITDWTEGLGSFDDTAGLLAHLDLVISVDTAVVHLAAALGKPVWVLSRFDGCWRWLLDRYDSPWYASLRLFRQESPGDWAPTIEALRAALIALVASGDRATWLRPG
jgi:tetratricopeptide (TPR) repeat protein